MKKIKVLATLVTIFILVLIWNFASTIHRVEQDELCFAYNVTSGMAVNPEENPILPFGWDFRFGWNERFFCVSSQTHQYNFSKELTDNSPYDESLSCDSKEGVTMEVDVTVLAHVDNVWRFYENYGQTQYFYNRIRGLEDRRIYESIREAEGYVDVKLGEIAQEMDARELKKSVKLLNDRLTEEARSYMSQFGIHIDDVIISSRFNFPGGNIIDQATNKLGDVNSTLEKKKKELKKAEAEKKNKIANANIEGDAILSVANVEANKLISEGKNISMQLKKSVELMGNRDKATELYLSREFSDVLGGGSIENLYLDTDSIIGEMF